MKKEENILGYLKKIKPSIDKTIEKFLPRKVNEKWLEMVFGKPRYAYSKKAIQGALLDPLWNFLDRGGKRWRPALFLLVGEAVGGDIRKLRDFVIIPELAHNGSIIIDDVEDEGEIRRGKSSLHRMFGVDIAINAGNFLYFLPLIAFFKNEKKFKPDVLVRAFEVYSRELMNIHLGQGTDIYWHKGKAKDIREREYLQMCAYKTGCLARMAAKLAVILSGGSDKLAEKIGRVAEAIGVAFQIQDDLLDITLTGKEREKFGKSFGNDIKEGKRSLMVIHTLKKATPRDRKRLLEILDKHTDNLKEKEEAIAIIKKYGSIEYAKKVARKIVKEAWQEADKLLAPSSAKRRLKNFVNFLIERNV